MMMIYHYPITSNWFVVVTQDGPVGDRTDLTFLADAPPVQKAETKYQSIIERYQENEWEIQNDKRRYHRRGLVIILTMRTEGENAAVSLSIREFHHSNEIYRGNEIFEFLKHKYDHMLYRKLSI